MQGGLAFVSALACLVTKVRADQRFAMTGVIRLTGKVLPVSADGVVAKLQGATKTNRSMVLVPTANLATARAAVRAQQAPPLADAQEDQQGASGAPLAGVRTVGVRHVMDMLRLVHLAQPGAFPLSPTVKASWGQA